MRTQADLAHLDDEEFRRLVDADTRGKAPDDVASGLRSPECVERWLMELQRIHTSVIGQLTVRANEYQGRRAQAGDSDVSDLRAEYFLKRASTLRFKSGLESTIAEALFLRDAFRAKPHEAILIDERNTFAKRAARMAEAIAAHRRALEDDDIEPGSADEALWSVLDLTI
jgi:hypothetical protein